MWIASSLVGPTGARPPPKPTASPQMRTSPYRHVSGAYGCGRAELHQDQSNGRRATQEAAHDRRGPPTRGNHRGVIRFPRHSVSVERTRRRREFTAHARRLPRPGRHRRLLLSRSADPDLCNDRDQSPLAGALFKGDNEIADLLKTRARTSTSRHRPPGRQRRCSAGTSEQTTSSPSRPLTLSCRGRPQPHAY